MDKSEYISFCRREFEARGFRRQKNALYLVGHDLLCGLQLQKSNYGNIYYINYYYFIGQYENTIKFPTYYESDIEGRIVVMSKSQTVQGKQFMTAMIEYEEYSADELKPFFDNEFEERILPPINLGKKYIANNLNTLYFLTLNQNEVKRKLQL